MLYLGNTQIPFYPTIGHSPFQEGSGAFPISASQASSSFKVHFWGCLTFASSVTSASLSTVPLVRHMESRIMIPLKISPLQ